MPLCARCLGTELGALVGLCNFWLSRPRASRLPPLRILLLVLLFFALWAVDSVNSYVHFATGRALLYAPSNILRLATGLLNGLSLSVLVFPMFNFALWTAPEDERVVGSSRELAGLLLQLVALGVVLLAGIDVLLYPLVLLNLLSVLLMLTLVNSMIAIIVLRRENLASGWRQALFPLTIGFFLSIGEAGTMATLRYWLSIRLTAALF